ncbi:uncharacterized protein UV8b_02590 [Ustilaginoidea virens]|uniref:RING-type domain-containing protein n=1 Tax=Ustilaginoidea virens TaxID=1159556 RepID=A0A8E5HMS4_USTVR|nr:uncharacterized protein UV8b_02590 [Ustilaginoidea virens]QUC18349.1 hypothetical protein UV8b_02590 [Ustilaginoidea virens]
MDQMNFLPNNSRRFSAGGAPVQASPNSWLIQSHHSRMSAWQNQQHPLPSSSVYYSHQHAFGRPSIAPDSVQPPLPIQPGTLPHPDRGLRALQNSDSAPGLSASPVYWASTLQPMPAISVPLPVNISAVNSSSGDSASVAGFGSMNPGGRGFMLQPPVTVDWTSSPGITSDAQSHVPLRFAFSERLSNESERPSSFPNTGHSYPISPTSPRRASQLLSPSSQRVHRSQSSASSLGYRDFTGLPSPASERRRQPHARARRIAGSRQSGSDPSRSLEEANDYAFGDSPTRAPRLNRRNTHGAIHSDESVARQIQMLRGAVSSKLVASKAALQSLESVDISDLPNDEKICVICYNAYGVASPEGVNEAPLRLPACKHVFGDHCIKKWLEDSDSCPYCRNKLQSEQKHSYGSARTFMNMMRMRGLPLPAGITDELLTRLATRPMTESELHELFTRAVRPAERRSPPDDDAAGQDQRRTRQRRNGPTPVPDSSPSSLLQSASRNLMLAEGPWSVYPALSGAAQPYPQQRSQTRPANELNERRVVAETSNPTRTQTRNTDPEAPVIAHGSSIRNPSLSSSTHTTRNAQRPTTTVISTAKQE